MRGKKSSFLLRAQRVDGTDRLEVTHLESTRTERFGSLGDAMSWIRERWIAWESTENVDDLNAAPAAASVDERSWRQRVKGLLGSRRNIFAAGGVVAVLAVVGIVMASGIADVGDLSTAARSNARLTRCDPATVRVNPLPSIKPAAPQTPCPTPLPTATVQPTPTPVPATPTPTVTPTPTPVPAPAAGSVWTWGGAGGGDQLLPLPVSGLSGAVAISAPNGGQYSLARQTDGSVWSWPATFLDPAAKDPNVSAVAAVAAGRDAWYALMPNGTVVNSSNVDLGLSGVTAIAAGDGALFRALKTDGTVWDATQQIAGIDGVKAIATGAEHTLALKSDGTVWAWGTNDFGQCGVDTAVSTNVATPTQIPGLANVVAIAAGSRQSMALKSDGTVWMLGQNSAYQLGLGLLQGDASYKPSTYQASQVVGEGGNGFLTGITAISSGRLHALALTADGTVYAWGQMQFGGLGDGTSDPHPSPIKVKLPPSANAKVVAIGGGRNHSIALYGAK